MRFFGLMIFLNGFRPFAPKQLYLSVHIPTNIFLSVAYDMLSLAFLEALAQHAHRILDFNFDCFSDLPTIQDIHSTLLSIEIIEKLLAEN